MNEACASVNGSFWHGRRVTCIPRARSGEEKRGSNNPKSPRKPTAQLYIGNIPYETTDVELNRLFRGLDNIKDVRVAVDRTTGWPRGFAHADFPSVQAAEEAFKRLEGVTLADRKLKIDYAEGYQRKPARN
jgi:RNA recognition motif-containing protein